MYVSAFLFQMKCLMFLVLFVVFVFKSLVMEESLEYLKLFRSYSSFLSEYFTPLMTTTCTQTQTQTHQRRRVIGGIVEDEGSIRVAVL